MRRPSSREISAFYDELYSHLGTSLADEGLSDAEFDSKLAETTNVALIWMTWWEKRAVRRALRRLGARDKRVLDAGCGTGILWRRFLKSETPPDLYGLDVSKSSLDVFKNVGKEPIMGDIQAAPFKPASFDVVLCLDIVEHVVGNRAKSHILVEMGRLVRPGGVLIVAVPHIMPMPRAYRFARAKEPEIKAEFRRRLRAEGRFVENLLFPLSVRMFSFTDDLLRHGLVKRKKASFDENARELEIRSRIPVHDELEHDEWMGLFRDAGFGVRFVEPAGMLVPDHEVANGSPWTLNVWRMIQRLYRALSRDSRWSYQIVAVLAPTPRLGEVEERPIPFPRQRGLEDRSWFELLAGFPVLDQHWADAYDAALAAGAKTEVVAAPDEFSSLLRWVVSPAGLRVGEGKVVGGDSGARVSIAILHKGRLSEIDPAALARIADGFVPVYANEVFVVLSEDPDAPRFTAAESPHLSSFYALCDGARTKGGHEAPEVAAVATRH